MKIKNAEWILSLFLFYLRNVAKDSVIYNCFDWYISKNIQGTILNEKRLISKVEKFKDKFKNKQNLTNEK